MHESNMRGSDPIKVSAIVPTFNRAAYLPQSLDALLQQSRPLHEIIVVDDGSTDETVDVIKPYLSRIRYYRKENGGRPTALNFGLRYVSGDYVWFMDDDDVAIPAALDVHTAYLQTHPDVDFTYSRGYVFQGDHVPPDITGLPIWKPPECAPEALFTNLLENANMLLQGMLIPLRCVEAVGGFDPRLVRAGDWDFLLRLSRRFLGGFIPEPTFLFRNHDGPRGPAHDRHDGKERFSYFQKYERILFEKVYEQTPLSAYAFQREHSYEDANLQVDALLKRAYVMARNGLFDKALQDLERAYSSMEISDLTPENRTYLTKLITDAQPLNLDEAAQFIARICRSTIPRQTELAVLRLYLKGSFKNAQRALRRRHRLSLNLLATGYCVTRYAKTCCLRVIAR